MEDWWSRRPTRQYQRALFEGYAQELKFYPWQLLGTLTQSDEYARSSAEAFSRGVHGFFERKEREEGLDIGAFYSVALQKGRYHAHFVALGEGQERRSCRRTLADVNPRRWSDQWACLSQIVVPSSVFGAGAYVSVQVLKHWPCEIHLYDESGILQRVKFYPSWGPPVGSDEELAGEEGE
jgi:hypothetical protein